MAPCDGMRIGLVIVFFKVFATGVNETAYFAVRRPGASTPVRESELLRNFFVRTGVKSWWYETDYVLESHGLLHSRNSIADQCFIKKTKAQETFQLSSSPCWYG